MDDYKGSVTETEVEVRARVEEARPRKAESELPKAPTIKVCPNHDYGAYIVDERARKIFPELADVYAVILHTDNQGFVSTTHYSEREEFEKVCDELDTGQAEADAHTFEPKSDDESICICGESLDRDCHKEAQ